MPGYKGHILGGAVVYAPMFFIFHSYATPMVAVWWFALAIAGALFPDIDTKSKGQKWFYRTLFLVLITLLLLKRFALFIAFSLMASLPLIVNHRGLFHRLWFVVFVPLVVAATFDWYKVTPFDDALIASFFFIAGAVSHLVLDFGLKRTFSVRLR